MTHGAPLRIERDGLFAVLNGAYQHKAALQSVGARWRADGSYRIPLLVSTMNTLHRAGVPIQTDDPALKIVPEQPWLVPAREMPRIGHPRWPDLYGYQREAVDFLCRTPYPGALLALSPGLGKAQPLTAKILTPMGWTLMGAINPGDIVYHPSGRWSIVQGVFPQGVRRIYRVSFSDGSSTECCAEHIWNVFTKADRSTRNRSLAGRLLTTEELTKDLFQPTGRRKYFVPMVAPVPFPAKNVPVSPYLLGVLLGDGCFQEDYIGFCCYDGYVVEQASSMLPPPVTMRLNHYPHNYRLTKGRTHGPNPLIIYMRQLGLMGHKSDKKFVPDCYKFSSIEDRIALLQGLLDTDGHVRPKDNNIEYCTSSIRLAEDVQEIVWSLGGTAAIRSRIPYYTHKGVRQAGQRNYRMSIALPPDVEPFRTPIKASVYHPRHKYPPMRAIVSIEPVNEASVQCIKVDAPDGLYVTDDYIVTHNTPTAIVAAEMVDAWNVLVICPKVLIPVWRQERERWASLPWNDARQDRLRIWQTVNWEYVLGHPSEFDTYPWDIVILDESVLVKNRQTQRFKLAKKLRKRTDRMWLLSGSPVTRYVDDLWTQLHLCFPDGFSSFWRWADAMCYVQDNPWGGKDIVGSRNYDFPQELKDIQFTKNQAEVLPDLPDFVEQNIPIELRGQQKKLYDHALKDFLVDLEGEEMPITTRIAQLTRLQQLVSHPANCDSAYRGNVGKLDALLELLDAHAIDLPLLVWTYYRKTAIAVDMALSERGLRSAHVTGGMEDKAETVIRLFKEGQLDALVLSQNVGKYGLTLTHVKTCVYYDKTFDADAYVQSLSRIRRIGLDHIFYIINLHCPHTTDDLILDNLADKSRSIASVSNADLSSLLRAL